MLNVNKRGLKTLENTTATPTSAHKSSGGEPETVDMLNKVKPTIFNTFTNFLGKKNEDLVTDPCFREPSSK